MGGQLVYYKRQFNIPKQSCHSPIHHKSACVSQGAIHYIRINLHLIHETLNPLCITKRDR